MKTILITGGTGLVGKALASLLVENGYKVVILTRNLEGKQSGPQLSYASWNIAKQEIDEAAIAGADAIIHLAGAGVADKRWTKSYKKEILQSRTQSAALLIKALKEIPNKITTVVSASAIGWYGEDKNGNPPFTENAPPADDFLGATCVAWETSMQPLEAMGKRLVVLRTGIVLSNEGGAFKEFSKPLNMGVAAILGSGKQIISWIHIMDMCRMYLRALKEPEMKGVYNAVAPHPVSNKELTMEIAKRLRPGFHVPIHVPAFALKIVLGEMSIEVLKSATVSASKIKTEGFQFRYPSIEAAVADLVKK